MELIPILFWLSLKQFATFITLKIAYKLQAYSYKVAQVAYMHYIYKPTQVFATGFLIYIWNTCSLE